MPGKKTKSKKNEQIFSMVHKKCTFYQKVIQKTLLHVQRSKFQDILVISDVTRCVKMLNVIHANICKVLNGMYDMDEDLLLKKTQEINNDLSMVIKSYGTESLEDMLVVCIGTSCVVANNENDKFGLLKEYFHPTGYSILNNKHLPSPVFCEDIVVSSASFHLKVYGVNVSIFDETNKKVIQIIGVLDDIMPGFVNETLILETTQRLHHEKPSNDEFHGEIFDKFIETLTLKDYMLYEVQDIYSKFMGYVGEAKTIREKELSSVVKRFVDEDMFTKRFILLVLLVHSSYYENQYLAYLLYDTLTSENDNTIDTQEQTILFDSFPWTIKQLFKDAMKLTAQYTTSLSHFDIQKIPMEQQICLMKAPDSVKEKAMTKLKELKNKSEDSGGKARQYLDGLLKIPFGIYRKEKILSLMGDVKCEYINMIKERGGGEPTREQFTIVDILNYMEQYMNQVGTMTRSQIVEHVREINLFVKRKHIASEEKISYVGKTKSQMQSDIQVFMNNHPDFQFKFFGNIHTQLNNIRAYLNNVQTTLDKSVYGHEKAKKQINKIVGQWINGEQKGYCFGFEGPPGSGKTSLAKYGLAHCLKDENGEARPFAMIQMGGDCQGSTLVGHNYTYVGSTWGSIVQILIDKKCMNPIIFIDEVDKVSKTEHGRELIGIMTHMLDPTQNDCFQDKYFSGVDIDLSQALFVLSYNDASLIDRILLDRIHRVKFDALSLEEKVVISQQYILPDVYKRMGLVGSVTIDEDSIRYLIEEHTFEAGVRKLKELFFDIVGEINLRLLTQTSSMKRPIMITRENIHDFMKEKQRVVHRKIYKDSKVACVNGMYATSLGTGGLLPISCSFYPSNQFLNLKLTGLQQEVMKESMHLGLTIAWRHTSAERQLEIREKYEKTNCSAINIHAGDLDVQKEGPSAGIAVCTTIYSLLNDLPIKQNVAVTGEISMHGDIMAIGGLDHKILGSIKSGANYFIFPKENTFQYDEFREKYKDDDTINSMTYLAVENITEVFEVIFDVPVKPTRKKK